MEETTRIFGARSGSSAAGAQCPDVTGSLQFEEEVEIQSLFHPPAFDAPSATGKNSFTALLGLTSNQAVELLHHPDTVDRPGAVSAAPSDAAAASINADGGGEMWRRGLPNAGLVEHAARLSVFAVEESPASSSCCGGSGGSPKPKAEPRDSDGEPICPLPAGERPQQRPGKRKDGKINKAPAKKSKIAEENAASTAAEERAGEGAKLPYVYVRVRRGQATDSHSLAERARREKINARMKLLQELVPGCSKISGTTLVLDEIINHVQALQRQVEFLSMRLAAVNPRFDFPGLDSFLPPEMTRIALEPTTTAPPWSSEAAAVNGESQQAQQQLWHVDLLQPNPRQLHQHEASDAVWTKDDTHPNILINQPWGFTI